MFLSFFFFSFLFSFWQLLMFRSTTSGRYIRRLYIHDRWTFPFRTLSFTVQSTGFFWFCLRFVTNVRHTVSFPTMKLLAVFVFVLALLSLTAAFKWTSEEDKEVILHFNPSISQFTAVQSLLVPFNFLISILRTLKSCQY